MTVILSAKGIKKTYGDNIALDGIDLELHKGQIFALLGPNGAGKTTFIKIIATLLTKDEGSVEILGYNLDTDEDKIKHLLGYVGQDTERSAYARLTARENLHFFGSLRGLSKESIEEKIKSFGNYFDFEDFDKQFMHLSGGQKQAIVIMRALLHDPPIIYLDEPTKGLDPIIAKKIRKFLVNYAKNEGKSLLITSHILTEVDEMADQVALIKNGKIHMPR